MGKKASRQLRSTTHSLAFKETQRKRSGLAQPPQQLLFDAPSIHLNSTTSLALLTLIFTASLVEADMKLKNKIPLNIKKSSDITSKPIAKPILAYSNTTCNAQLPIISTNRNSNFFTTSNKPLPDHLSITTRSKATLKKPTLSVKKKTKARLNLQDEETLYQHTLAKCDAHLKNMASLPGNTSLMLHLAIKKNDEKAIKTLLATGSNATVQDEDGNTPLHLAMSLPTGSTTIIAELLAHGANPDTVNNKGLTAVALAIETGEIAFGYVMKQRYVTKGNEKLNLINGHTAIDWSPILLLKYGAVLYVLQTLYKVARLTFNPFFADALAAVQLQLQALLAEAEVPHQPQDSLAEAEVQTTKNETRYVAIHEQLNDLMKEILALRESNSSEALKKLEDKVEQRIRRIEEDKKQFISIMSLELPDNPAHFHNNSMLGDYSEMKDLSPALFKQNFFSPDDEKDARPNRCLPMQSTLNFWLETQERKIKKYKEQIKAYKQNNEKDEEKYQMETPRL